MKVFKFGGASVKNAAAVRNVSDILKTFKEDKIIIVVSAMGKTTNKLEELVTAFQHKNEHAFLQHINDLKSFHQEIIDDLFGIQHEAIKKTIDNIFEQLTLKFTTKFSENFSFEYDQIVSLGEVISSHIVAAYLAKDTHACSWTDARTLIRTNHQYQEGLVDWKKTEELIQNNLLPMFDKNDIVLTQGFLGHTSEGFTTTLGREGSDYTAGILAYCTNAESVTIWKDVPGMLNADPKYFENTIKLDQISFKEAIELSYYGASVIHPKTIKPLQNKGIPLFVKSFIEPKAEGTIIQASTEKDHLVPSYIFKKQQRLISFTTKDFSFIIEEHLGDIFKKLSDLNVKINLMQNTALDFSILVDSEKTNSEKIHTIFDEMYEVKIEDELELVTIRYFDDKTIAQVSKQKQILVEQKIGQTARIVLK